jgi:uncharacterized protein
MHSRTITDDPTRRHQGVTVNQADVIAYLSSPTAYGSTAPIQRIDTHSSVVFLVDERVFKLKRAVRYDYLDYSTVERRRECCMAEVRLNRRTAPSVYHRVRVVTCDGDGTLALDGDGAAVEWLVEMSRFDESDVLDGLAERGTLDLALMPALARAVAKLHAVAEWRFDRGGRRGMAWVIDGNADGFHEYGQGALDPAACRRLTTRTHEMLERHADRLMARRAQGYVRRCHGDLHLRNVCLLDGQPTLFDCIEFSDQISCIDVLYDLAFLVMDLLHRGLPRHAHAVCNEYVVATADVDGLALMPLFLSVRAAVRAKTSATAARLQVTPAEQERQQQAARDYLSLALSALDPAPAKLVAVGGLSGAGKSVVARELAPAIGAAPGALVLRSDVVRKSLLGVAPAIPLGSEGYAAGVTRRVYRELASRAAIAVAAGHSVIVDAVFADPRDRMAIADIARRGSVPFYGVWLDAPVDTRAARVARRTGDASDATPVVLREQLARGIGELDWPHVDAAGEREATARAVKAFVEGAPETGG